MCIAVLQTPSVYPSCFHSACLFLNRYQTGGLLLTHSIFDVHIKTPQINKRFLGPSSTKKIQSELDGHQFPDGRYRHRWNANWQFQKRGMKMKLSFSDTKFNSPDLLRLPPHGLKSWVYSTHLNAIDILLTSVSCCSDPVIPIVFAQTMTSATLWHASYAPIHLFINQSTDKYPPISFISKQSFST